MVTGGDPCSKGHEFESRHCILDEHFFTYLLVLKFVMCLKRLKYMKKRPGLALKKYKFPFQIRAIWLHLKMQIGLQEAINAAIEYSLEIKGEVSLCG